MTTPVAVPPNPDTFVVTGGRGFAARLESLDASASSLAAAAAALDRVQKALYIARHRVEAAVCALSVVGPRISDESRRIEAVVRRCVDEATREESAVRRAAASYAEEEAKRRSALDGLQNVLVDSDAIAGLLSIVLPRALFADRRVPAAAPGHGAAGFLRSVDPSRFEGRGDDATDVEMRVAVGGRGDGGTFAYAVRSLREAQGQEPLDDGTTVPPSSILVERFLKADGSVTVMVAVPGTQTWGADPSDGNILDSESILDGMARPESHVRTLIKRALEDQGLGPGDKVVFNCYSQGSIHVLGLLEDHEFTERYQVAGVMSVGGPVSAFAIPEDVPVLSLSNADDIVPATSGRLAPPSGSLVDVRTPSRTSPAAAAFFPKETVANAHSLDWYAQDASALDTSAAPAVREFAGAMAAALGGSAAVGAGAAGAGAAAAGAAGAGTASAGASGAGAGAVGAGAVGAGAAGAGSAVGARERFIYTGTDPRTKAGTGG
ncbi:hypothetical protein [Sinomonas sp. ASV322]|uniref:hypothetical protein n=1 Tax=Sinomonas sp. ASV322 TaxID=3041920 RepID=UPI0027DE8C7C|nr:hypothetical protein [Sinomonas sp. ASV322]MDQ4503499.1 hypothetical protein [Sinomonas sp. ASV322]